MKIKFAIMHEQGGKKKSTGYKKHMGRAVLGKTILKQTCRYAYGGLVMGGRVGMEKVGKEVLLNLCRDLLRWVFNETKGN